MKPVKTQTLAQGVKTNVPSNFALSFDITPTGIVSNDWSSIIHFTQDYSDSGPKGRIPGMIHFLISGSILILISI